MLRLRFLTVLFIAFAGVQSSNDQIWHHWKRLHGKRYNTSLDEQHRRSIWEKNVAHIQEHNLKHDLGLISYTKGLNQFSDLDWTEFSQIYLPHKMNKMLAKNDKLMSLSVSKEPVPIKMDWREKKGIVTKVKYQGACGSCWAFAATGAVEGQYNQKFPSTAFSEQQLVDCSKKFGNHGCRGGSAFHAYKYIHEYGLETESVYPYRAKNSRCNYNRTQAKAAADAYWKVPRGNEVKLKILVGSKGPAAVAINANKDFQHYKGGIYISSTCDRKYLNHAVLVVGYDKEDGQAFWIVKNSWGKSWGESGYIKMARNRDDMCGIAEMANVPRVHNMN